MLPQSPRNPLAVCIRSNKEVIDVRTIAYRHHAQNPGILLCHKAIEILGVDSFRRGFS